MPTELTPGVERARHLAHCFYTSRVMEICRDEKIDLADVSEGIRLAWIDKDLRKEMCLKYGRPEYGSWPASAEDYRKHRFDELNAADLARRAGF